jgi:hypothetical protein
VKLSKLLVQPLLCAALVVVHAPRTAGAPPTDRGSNVAFSEWFRSLKQPRTMLSCCSISDCRSVEYRIADDGTYEARIEGAWYRVPDTVILERKVNPLGSAVACYTRTFGYGTLAGKDNYDGDGIDVLCFVPELPTS